MKDREIKIPVMSAEKKAWYRDLGLLDVAYMTHFPPKVEEGEFPYYFGIASLDKDNPTREILEAKYSQHGKMLFDWDHVPVIDRSAPGEVRFVSGKEYAESNGDASQDAVTMVFISTFDIFKDAAGIIIKP